MIDAPSTEGADQKIPWYWVKTQECPDSTELESGHSWVLTNTLEFLDQRPLSTVHDRASITAQSAM